MTSQNIDDSQMKSMANLLRFLAIDAIENANSGHPGMPMGMADVVTVLFAEFLNFDNKNPQWLNRDRFILSAGHGSMLLYALLYCCNYGDITIDDIKNFRQLNSKCAGHPEFGHLEAIETTTGPLGQGIANAVGMALASKTFAAKFNNLTTPINHKTYCVVGDGCLMEGVSYEAVAFAGHLQLNNLVVMWDNNSISIDGDVAITTSENMHQRFNSCNWEVIAIDGHNISEIRSALKKAQLSTKPVLIDCKTTIAFGSPNKAGSAKSHGSPLGKEETLLTRKNLGWNYQSFEVPPEVLSCWHRLASEKSQIAQQWQKDFSTEKENAKEVERFLSKNKVSDVVKTLSQEKLAIINSNPNEATRKSSQNVLEIIAKNLPQLISGSADLTESVLTKVSNSKIISAKDFSGNYIHYGVREHLMASMMNGIALYKGFIPLGGTFLVFSDYMKPAIRLSAMMQQQVIYLFTHDSIGLGEDGPTHQPIEHLAMLRSIPNLIVFRPCDARETLESYQIALTKTNNPSVIIASRQNLQMVTANIDANINLVEKGGYVLSDNLLTGNKQNSKVVIVASGSEVQTALEVQNILLEKQIYSRVVSMPSTNLFDIQEQSYREDVLCSNDKNILKVAVEAGCDQNWHRYIGSKGMFFGINSFGASAKASDLYRHFRLNANDIANDIAKKIWQ